MVPTDQEGDPGARRLAAAAGLMLVFAALALAAVVMVSLAAPPARSQAAGVSIENFLNGMLGFKPDRVEIAPMAKPGENPSPGSWTTVPNGFFNGILGRSGITPGASSPEGLIGRPGFIGFIGVDSRGEGSASGVLNPGGTRTTFGYWVRLTNPERGRTEVVFVLMSYDVLNQPELDNKPVTAFEVFIFGPLPLTGSLQEETRSTAELPLIAGLAVNDSGVLLPEVPRNLAGVVNYSKKADAGETVKPGVGPLRMPGKNNPLGSGCFRCHSDRGGSEPNSTAPFPWTATMGQSVNWFLGLPQPGTFPNPETPAPPAQAPEAPAKPNPDQHSSIGGRPAGQPGAGGLEARVVAEINRARTDPKGYAATLQGPSGAARDEARVFLRGQPPLPPLTASPPLDAAAARHAADQGPGGVSGHTGSDGSGPRERIQQAGVWSSIVAEDISLGQTTAAGVVGQLIIDAGVPGRPHRQDLFNPLLGRAGAGCGPDKGHHAVCVVDLAGAPPRAE